MSSRDKDPEKRRRRKDRDRERESKQYVEEAYGKVKSKDKHKDRDTTKRSSTRKASTSSKDRERSPPRRERSYGSSSHGTPSSRGTSILVPEMERRGSATSPAGSKASTPYPTFSKAHSRESVGAREGVPNPRLSLYTPDPTDLGRDFSSKAGTVPRPATTGAAPPSPPLTATEPDLRRTASGTSFRKTAERPQTERLNSRHSLDGDLRAKLQKREGSSSRLPRSGRAEESATTRSSRHSKPSKSKPTASDHNKAVTSDIRSSELLSSTTASSNRTATTATQSASDSDATSVPLDYTTARRVSLRPVDADSSPASAIDSSPRTPTPHDTHLPHDITERKLSPVEVFQSDIFRTASAASQYSSAVPPPHPLPPPTPPPPPPPN